MSVHRGGNVYIMDDFRVIVSKNIALWHKHWEFHTHIMLLLWVFIWDEYAENITCIYLIFIGIIQIRFDAKLLEKQFQKSSRFIKTYLEDFIETNISSTHYIISDDNFKGELPNMTYWFCKMMIDIIEKYWGTKTL